MNETSIKLYHERITRKNDEAIWMCAISKCDYNGIIYNSYTRNEYDKHVNFFEKALYENISGPAQVMILLNLYDMYSYKHNLEKKLHTLQKNCLPLSC